MYNAHRYIIDASKPFTGSTQNATYLNEDGEELVYYTGGAKLADYIGNRPLKVLTWDELEPMLLDFHNSLKTKPVEITKERYWEMLECLPPERYKRVAGAETFHMSERLTGELVSWFVNKGSKYYEFTDKSFISEKALIEIVAGL